MITLESITEFTKSYESMYKLLYVYTYLKLTNKTVLNMDYKVNNKDGVITFSITYEYYNKYLKRVSKAKKVLFSDLKEWHDEFIQVNDTKSNVN